MTTHLEGPAGQSAYRVPRTRVDDYYVRGVQVEPTRSGTGVVVSVDGDTCTVLIGDEEVSGVVFLGDAPIVGDAYDLEMRGDLLVLLADDYDYDAYAIGSTIGAAHIVDDTDPGGPAPVEVNIGGAMRSIDPWVYDANAHGWHRALAASGVGIHVWQAAGVLQSRNLCLTPSFEFGLGTWHSNTAFGTQAAATLTQDPTRYLYGTKSLRVDWPAKGTTGGSNAVHGKVPLDPAKRYVASMHVYIPEGSPDVRATNLFTDAGPYVTDREKWVWTSVEFAPAADGNGNYFGIGCDDPSVGTMCWVDAVVLRDATTPFPPDLLYFDGSFPATADTSYAWEGAAGNSISDWYNGQLGVPGIGTLWSTEAFDVLPGDLLDLAAIATKVGGVDGTVQLAVCYSPDSERDPATVTDPVLTYGAAVTINGDAVAIAAQAVVPATLPDGTSVPARAVIGFRLNGAGTADLVLNSATLMHTDATWPIGSLWLNPAAGLALPTVGSTVSTTNAATSIPWQGAVGAWGRMPNAYKALVTAPPDSDGIVVAWFTGCLSSGGTSSTVGLEMSIRSDGALSASDNYARYATTVFNANQQMMVSFMGWARIAAGSTVEVYPAYRYGNDPGSTAILGMRSATLMVLYIPTGVANGDPAGPAPVSFWDGDSWRPGTLKPATMDLTKPANSVEPGKTATTTTIARSAGDVHAGTDVTLTATVSPLAADGSVTFYSSPTGTGSWTSLGSVTIDANNKATKRITTSGSTTTYYRATYAGSATYATSTSGTTGVRSRTKRTATKTLNAKWVQAYSEGGNEIPAGDFDAGAHQGASAGSDPSNRRSVIGFPQPTFSGTDITVNRVTLVCKAWERWQASNNQGTLVTGWHEVTGSSAPGSYPFDRTHNDKSRAGKGEGSWTVNLTSWADTIVMRSDFGGISIGPGANMSNEFGGFSDNGPGKWQLEVEATYWA